MENHHERKCVEVTFVSDQDVEREIISIKDRNKTKSEIKHGRKRKYQNGNTIDKEEEEMEELDEVPPEISDASEKPTELFDIGDVRGQEMFGFQTPKSKNALTKTTDSTPQSEKVALLRAKLNGTTSRQKNDTPQKKFNITPQKSLNSTPQKKLYITPQKKLNSSLLGNNKTPLRNINVTPQGKLDEKSLLKKYKKSLQSSVVGTPRTSSYKVTTAKTPYSLRNRLKTRIANIARNTETNSSESDFSGSESDYKPTDSDSSSSSAEEEEQGEEEECVDDCTEKIQKTKSKPRREIKQHETEYVLEADEFFSSSQKSVTSNNTLNRLKQPRLAEEQLQELLENMTLSHQEAVRSLCDEYSQCFIKWMFALSQQYTVLLYGLGSKLRILQQFRKTMLQDQLVLEINGFFPSLTIKEVVETIADELLELEDRPSGLLECLEAIETEMSSDIYVIIHNLEGPMLRSDKSQDILSRLASMEHVHFIASIDHINAPLIWDHAKHSRYNFLWWDVTSFQPYCGETQFETSLLVHQSGKLALSSLSNVFHSLTTNARNIFIKMVEHQLKHHKDPAYQGMLFKDLYWSAREALLVSSDIALRAQLTEFLDHRLVRQRRGHDGSELLQVPIDIAVLQRFIEQVEGGT